MGKFDYWQRWGMELDDTQFANAWAALGVAGGRRRVDETLLEMLVYQAELIEGTNGRLDWTFPRLRRHLLLAAETKPADWAAAWVEFARNREIRLQATYFPDDEPVLPWLRLLQETSPAVESVSFSVHVAGDKPPDFAWPLRFGCIAGNDCDRVIDATRQSWPADQLTRKVELGRAEANCDVLVYRGTPRVLLGELLALNVPLKAHFLLLLDAGSEDYNHDRHRLDAALAELRARGHALVRAPMSDDDVAAALNQFVDEVSHSEFFDVAIARSFGHRRFDQKLARRDLFAGYSDHLASFCLSDLVDTLAQRAQSMPEGTEIDLQQLGSRDKWHTRGIGTRADTPGLPPGYSNISLYPPPSMQPGPAPPPPPPPTPAAQPAATPRMAARELQLDAHTISFSRESEGASTIAAVSEALESADVPRAARRQRAARFLQQRSFVHRRGELVEARNGFIAKQAVLVRVRIGPADAGWDSQAAEFPEAALPQHLESWTLTVWLTEPEHLREPLSATIKLPRDGASTEAGFNFRPRGQRASFEGRLTVLHRGRVIHTALLRASVQPDAPELSDGAAPRLEDVIPVRQAIGELKHRQQFDLAFVLNHNSAGLPLAVALSARHAWISDLSQSKAIGPDISACLAPVAKSAADFKDGVRGEKGRVLLVKLAKLGAYLKLYLVKQQINASGNQPDIANAEYLQIISTRADTVIPFEFVFDHAAPLPDAKLCPEWKQGIERGKCATTCDRTTGKHVCPMGFWGLQKVIERHALTPELASTGREMFLQSEPAAGRTTLGIGGVGVFGASARVKAADVNSLAATLKKVMGKPPSKASDWDDWIECVGKSRPHLLLALAHTDGQGATASLELGGKAIDTINIREAHVRKLEDDPPPLVALLGCDTAGNGDAYGSHAAVFRSIGAAVVVATIATVLGEHAAKVGESLVAGLLGGDGDAPQRVGEALRAIKRKGLLEDQLMPLCLVAYGDADWRIERI